MQRCIEYTPPAVGRRFWVILLISVAIHAGMLAWNRASKVQQPELPPLMASLRAMSPVSPAPSEPLAETMPAAVPQKVRPQTAKRESPSTPVMTSSAESSSRVAQVPVVTPAAVTEVQSAPPVAAAVVAPPAASMPSQEDLLVSYRRRLTDLLARHQEYPRVAAMRGWEGEVRVRVRVARKGSLLGVTLDHSSGYDILDKHAIAMLEGLGGLPALPEEYGSSELQVVVPVSYSLRKPS
jgi:protein TonB